MTIVVGENAGATVSTLVKTAEYLLNDLQYEQLTQVVAYNAWEYLIDNVDHFLRQQPWSMFVASEMFLASYELEGFVSISVSQWLRC